MAKYCKLTSIDGCKVWVDRYNVQLTMKSEQLAHFQIFTFINTQHATSTSLSDHFQHPTPGIIKILLKRTNILHSFPEI